MADLSSLKERVELVDLRLKTAHGARERESAALMETWEQIRERFVNQSAEIVQLRERITELEDARDDLLQMVHGLLSAVEGGLDRMSDESVPRIRSMAANLLVESGVQTAPAEDPLDSVAAVPKRVEAVPEAAPPDSTMGSFQDELLQSIERSTDSPWEPEFTDDAHETDDVHEMDDVYDLDDRHMALESDTIKDTASPGIRNLVARIEDAMGPDMLEPSSGADSDDIVDLVHEEKDELSRDLQEIEALRGELHGLRQRISSGAV